MISRLTGNLGTGTGPSRLPVQFLALVQLLGLPESLKLHFYLL